MCNEIHEKSKAAVTIAVMPVAWEEASRFGIMNVDDEGNIIEFEEKPKNPKSNLASMGIYIFNYSVLKKYLTDDERDPASSNDFGKNIIPTMLQKGEKMVSYRFEGYWKDVGTVQSLWEANMDLLDTPPVFEISNKSWNIYSRNTALAPQYVGENARIKNSTISQGCTICGNVTHSVIFANVEIGEGSDISDCVIMPNVKIGKNVKLKNTIIGVGAVLEDGVTAGIKDDPDSKYISGMCTNGLVLIEGEAKIAQNTDIPKGSMVEVE